MQEEYPMVIEQSINEKQQKHENPISVCFYQPGNFLKWDAIHDLEFLSDPAGDYYYQELFMRFNLLIRNVFQPNTGIDISPEKGSPILR